MTIFFPLRMLFCSRSKENGERFPSDMLSMAALKAAFSPEMAGMLAAARLAPSRKNLTLFGACSLQMESRSSFNSGGVHRPSNAVTHQLNFKGVCFCTSLKSL